MPGSFIRRQDGATQTISAAHINELQFAIERLSPPVPPWIPGRWYGPNTSGPGAESLATSGVTALRHFASPFYVPKTVTVDAIAIEVTTAVAASQIRLGLYGMGANGLPGQLMVDAGVVATDTLGSKEIALPTNQQLFEDTWYYITGCCTHAIGCRITSAALGLLGSAAGGENTRYAECFVDRTSTAFPTTFGVPTGYTPTFFRTMHVRVKP